MAASIGSEGGRTRGVSCGQPNQYVDDPIQGRVDALGATSDTE